MKITLTFLAILLPLSGTIGAAPALPDQAPSHPAEEAARFASVTGQVDLGGIVFGYLSVDGDLTVLFSGYFDTTSGHKREAASYRRIAAEMGGGDILFLSDVVEELDAAREAGMKTCWLQRDFDSPGDHPIAKTFDEIEL